MRSILHVLKYLHSKGIVHRDIKPEHFLLTSDERESQKIKLIDFGLARKHKPGSAPMTTFTGSPSFVAPEVIARRYDHMCDMFSVGVTAYFLLTGMLPFDGPTDEETFDLISEGKFKFPSSSVFLSDDAKDFVTKLLRVDPNKRMSSGRALNHPWLLKAASC
jgi:calcium-dependent protein kinase